MTDPFPWRMIAETLARRIAEGHAAGRLEPGDRLPTYVDLSLSLGVAVGTVRKAVGLLVDLEYLRVEPGVGIFLREVPPVPLAVPMTPVPRQSVSSRLAEMTQRLTEMAGRIEELGAQVRDLQTRGCCR